MRYISKVKNKIINFDSLMLILVLILAGFTALPLTNENDDLVVVSQADLQIVRSEFIAKDVLVLAYRPISFRSQAVSDLQTVLPMFQQAQKGFQYGDTALGIPGNPQADIYQALLDAQPHYVAMVAATKVILANPDSPPDPVEVNIVLQHETPYTLAMYQAATFELQHNQWSRNQLIALKLAIDFIVMLIILRPKSHPAVSHIESTGIKSTD